MNLTEPQAGSDLGAITTRAVPACDPQWGNHYLITGQKIFITYEIGRASCRERV